MQRANDSVVFVMDAFTGIYVYYSPRAAALPLPPPADSLLRGLIKRIRTAAPLISPRIVFARAGGGAARYFDRNLIEEKGAAGFSYADFVDFVEAEVVKQFR
jgi:hypothetical protein